MDARYFAFGSNLSLAQMARRCPGAEPEAFATLPGVRLSFRGTSPRRLAGVLTVEPCDRPGAQVRGLVWRLSHAHLETLDRHEGHPHFYRRTDVRVRVEQAGSLDVIAYVLPTSHPPNAPTEAYLADVLQGYVDQGFDPDPVHRAARAAGLV